MHSIKDTVKQLIGKSLDAYNKKYTSPINNRIDNIVAQAGTDNTEIVDARIDSAGVSHTTLNNRILAETKMTDEKLIEYSGNSLSVDDTMPGYLQNIEIKGNTIQNEDNLEDIRSVGDKIEGQELYEIPVLSVGKNLLSCGLEIGSIASNGTLESHTGRMRTKEYIQIKNTSNYVLSKHNCATYWVFYDINYTFISRVYRSAYNITNDLIPNNAHFLKLVFVDATDTSINIQLEEGTQATPYEPYQEDKLTILSPVQLEKVGDVADRIICKDGVWGVEKNVKTVRLGSESAWYMRTNKNGITIFNTKDYLSNNIPNRVILCDTLTVSNGADQDAIDGYNQILAHKNSNYSQNLYISKDFKNIQLFTAWLDENPVNIKCVTETQPQFIPLPHDQQIKLRTFANKTNISFLTEIEGTIKAQVPKSIGATVNTHTEQISNLNKELDRVKKLEESTVSTVETESDFTTVEATNGGYFEDVKLEGKTLVNTLLSHTKISNDFSKHYPNWSITDVPKNSVIFKENTMYTFVVNITKNTTESALGDTIWFGDVTGGKVCYTDDIKRFPCNVGQLVFTVKTVSSFEGKKHAFSYQFNRNIASGIVEFDVVVLEGDHTQNPPSYFEGLKSVGQSATTSEDGVDEIVVSSVKGDGNLFEILEDIQSNSKGLDIKFDKAKQEIKVNGTCTDDLYFYAKSPNIDRFDIKAKNIVCSLSIDICEGTATIGDSNEIMHISIPNNLTGKAINLRVSDKFAKIENVSLGGDFTKSWIRFKKNARFNNCTIRIMLNKGTTPKPYTPYQSDKKRLLYYNDETQTWEKPILRRWDSIEKHADGKYYYHQRSGEVILNGSENWGMSGSNFGEFACFYLSFNLKINGKSVLSDKFASLEPMQTEANSVIGEGISTHHTTPSFRVIVNKSKLSTQDVAGFKQWLQANNVTVVYQLAEEKVYECTNIDLITYANETNYIVESGAIVPRTTLKVHNNISNVVSLLQKKVSLLESNITNYMITQNRIQLASTYSADSVTFKVDYALCSEEVEYNEDLYNLILNNILVGKDNYDYDKMFNIILDYTSWNQISWEQFDILVGVMDIRHNPPVEDEVIEEIPNEIM